MDTLRGHSHHLPHRCLSPHAGRKAFTLQTLRNVCVWSSMAASFSTTTPIISTASETGICWSAWVRASSISSSDDRGRLPDAAWIREIDPSLVGAEHAPVEIPFEVRRDERVYFERFEIETAGKVLEVEGSFGLDGSRDVRAKVTYRRD